MGGAIYDQFGSYAPAFAAGVGANLLNLVVIGFLVARRRDGASRVVVVAAMGSAD
jgi:hypothetical protein